MKFEQREIKDLLIAWILVSVAFAIALRQTDMAFGLQVLLSLVTVGVGFVVHELAHKYVAQRYKKHAAFYANLPMLLGSVAIAFSGIVLAAPGAVVVSGFVSRDQNGKISAAGPVSNLVLAILLLPFVFIAAPLIQIIATLGFLINSWLALFNMIPFSVFDGAKIFVWNKVAYTVITATAVILVFIGNLWILPTF